MPPSSIAGSAVPVERSLSPLGSLVLLGVSTLTIMVGSIIVPGLPVIAPALGIVSGSQWLVTLPALGVLLFGPFAGRYIDHAGAYRSLCVGLAMYGVFGIAAIWMRGALVVFADRVMLGGATVIVMSAGTALISLHYSGSERLRMMSRQGMAIELGGVVFMAAGGVITRIDKLAPFILYGIAFVLLAMVRAFLPATGSRRHQAIVDSGSWVRETIRPGFVLFCASASMVTFFTAILNLPYYLTAQDSPEHTLTQAEVGVMLSFVSLVAILAAGCMPSVARRVGGRVTLVVAFAFFAFGHLCFATSSSTLSLAVGTILLGTGFGLTIPLLNHMMIEQSLTSQRGINLARLSMAIFAGQLLSSFTSLLPFGYSGIFECSGLFAAATACAVGIWAWLRSAGD